MKTLKKIVINVFFMTLGLLIGILIGALIISSRTSRFGLIDNYLKLKGEFIQSLEDLAVANAELGEKDLLLKRYEAHDKVETEVNSIRKMQANIFATADTTIHIVEEDPLCIGSTNIQIGDIKLAKTEETVTVKFYFATYNDKISVENDGDEKIVITYESSSFLKDPPYDIISRKVEQNTMSKVLSNYGNDDIHVKIADEGRKLLSEAEDEFIRQLKESYADSVIPVVVNGVDLTKFSENDKKITNK